jgi:hypothetical protein
LSQKMISRLATMAAKTFTTQKLKLAGRTLAPLFVGLAPCSLAAHAQGNVDLTGVTTATASVETAAKLGGAIVVVIGIVFGVFQFMGRNIAGGFLSIGGGLFAGIVIGFALQWVSSLNRLRSITITREQVKAKAALLARSVAPAVLVLTVSSIAHAQGTVDFSGATTAMNSFKTFAEYAGAVICLGSLIFAGIRLMGGRFQDAIPGLFGALFGAGVLGWGAGWISSLTGQSVTQ